VTNWLEICRRAVEDVERVLAEMPPTERERAVGIGEGGDETSAIDEAAEQVVVARLDAEGGDFTLVSEELGIRPAREGSPTYVVVDPIDGSINAKRGIPFFSLSIAVADGGTMDDVAFGYVYDFGTAEEWLARRGEGAWLNGEALGGLRPKERIEILSFEATRTSLIARHAAAVSELAYRLRVMGSLALSLCHLAAGRVDGVCSLKEARSVDIAAAQLLCQEVGIALSLFDDPRPFGAAELDLEQRSRVAAAGTPDLCRQIADALSA
jgi:myo-inositol-1(or 4)-monophosphatase